ncbi:hypothetical protein C6361_07025 [Plantactinospora sp. BC1]|uniref:hypothetical protein n=1 Tax=Plantactinospora sp. BC1 TaxID=2108470 RepID=UPI000D157318|nr:hypothetical protein [Plantactinospora sp. BC1]AVT29284.1 hypothetical protein C6361_07025 [Plantactinospora sp. BC1]
MSPKVLQISVPRGGSNAVARMMGQSPDVAAVLRSRLLEDGRDGLFRALREVEREAPGRLPYVKEQAAFLPDHPDELFAPYDRFLVVVRDPVQQVASELLAVLGNRELLRDKLVERTGVPVGRRETARLLDRYAVAACADFPIVRSGVRGCWQDVLAYLRRTRDFRPVHRLIGDLYDVQPQRQGCASDTEWFNRAIFRVGVLCWLRAVDLVAALTRAGVRKLAVVDFGDLQTRPRRIAEVCDRLAVRFDERMVTGPWQPPGRWFEEGLDRDEGRRWVGRAWTATRLYASRPVPCDPRTLPPVAQHAVSSSMESYRALLSHPACLSPEDPVAWGGAAAAPAGRGTARR